MLGVLGPEFEGTGQTKSIRVSPPHQGSSKANERMIRFVLQKDSSVAEWKLNGRVGSSGAGEEAVALTMTVLMGTRMRR